ncbi:MULTISPECIES: DUF3016 domain-containing protein [Pseudoalteromonas]|uniref:DUF3016 domain-containing protein n=1 Tax=Pseudoalteromonas TaxID=53246 RepID=UPI0015FC9D8D|nr:MULTISPECIES: DUF3016 domain-containing protein [Pseudoalteromonas]MBB1328139.1 DUF3016 domain-containing protein [Pseudoalteromonas sp. SR43-7]MBD0412844.1 DUF3016 domain-containing protein [Pseudoalteromonas distincta]
MNLVKKIATTMCIALPALAHAGESVVKWNDFNDYRDVRASNQAKGSYHKSIAASFEKHMSKLAEQLPKDYKLNVEFTDLDLAGDVRYGGMEEIRVVKSIYFPRIKLNYSLTDNDGTVLSKDTDVELKDMGFMDKIKMGREESLYYEKRLLTEWFGEQILPSLD